MVPHLLFLDILLSILYDLRTLNVCWSNEFESQRCISSQGKENENGLWIQMTTAKDEGRPAYSTS